MRFDLPEITDDFTVAASVCWARTAGGTSWRLGCSFAHELPESLLSQLAVHGYIDRREGDRRAVGVPAVVQWEASREVTNMQLQDVSPGGFNLLSPVTAASGTRLRLVLDGPDGQRTAAGVVRWLGCRAA